MTLRPKTLAYSLLALAGLPGISSAFAPVPDGGCITYGPLSTAAIPTLSEWGLMTLGLLMTVMVYRFLRGRLGGPPIASIILACALGLAAVTSGSGWMSTVYAVDGPPLAAAGGGLSCVPGDNTEYNLINTSGVPQAIRVVAPQPGYSVNHVVTAPECIVGLVVAPGASCHVKFFGSFS